MSVTITIPAPLRQFAGGQSQIVVEAKTAGEAKDLFSWEQEPDRSRFNQEELMVA